MSYETSMSIVTRWIQIQVKRLVLKLVKELPLLQKRHAFLLLLSAMWQMNFFHSDNDPIGVHCNSNKLVQVQWIWCVGSGRIAGSRFLAGAMRRCHFFVKGEGDSTLTRAPRVLKIIIYWLWKNFLLQDSTRYTYDESNKIIVEISLLCHIHKM